jgi:hypothetical protein
MLSIIKLSVNAILMPKASIFLLFIVYPIRTILARPALQQRPSAIRRNRIYHPIFGHSGSQWRYQNLLHFYPVLIFHQR